MEAWPESNRRGRICGMPPQHFAAIPRGSNRRKDSVFKRLAFGTSNRNLPGTSGGVYDAITQELHGLRRQPFRSV